MATAAKKKSKAKAKAKPAETKRVEITQPVKAVSLSATLKAFIVRNPKLSTEELVAALDQVGFKGRSLTTIETLRSDCLTTLRAAREAGLYTVDF
jgi:hypothetical protein